MTTTEMVRACLETAATAFGSVFAVLAVFYVLIRILARSEAPAAGAADPDV
jgi:hypothetical protein